MLGKKNGKDIAMLILGGKKPIKEEKQESEFMNEVEETDGLEMEMISMEKFISAVKDGDAGMALDAFKELMEVCQPLED
jgi:hypothetical protein